MFEKRAFALLLAMFAVVQLLAFHTGTQYVGYVQAGQLKPMFENPEDPQNTAVLFAYILGITAIIILTIRFWQAFIRILEAFVVFFASWLVFEFLLPSPGWLTPGLILAVGLTAWKMLRPSILSQNVAVVIATAGAGAIIGASLGILPVLLFLLALSVYDFVAVFVTKHMVYMARAIAKQPTAFTAAVPAHFKKPVPIAEPLPPPEPPRFAPSLRARLFGFKRPAVLCSQPKLKYKWRHVHVFQLGGGDFAVPAAFTVSVLNAYTPAHAAFAGVGSFIALALLFAFAMKKPGRVLPALPPICAGGVIAFALSIMLL